MKLSVIIVNYKSRDYLQNCVSAINREKFTMPIEIIVVDNASNDGSVELVEENFPEVRLIRNKYNYGFATANNQGFEISNGEYVMTLNPDAVVVEDALQKLVEVLDFDPKVGIVSPCVVEQSGIVSIHFEFPKISFFKSLQKLGISRNKFVSEPPAGQREVHWLSGTGYLCRRAALGPRFFDDSTFLFAEEYELCPRIRKNGYTIVVRPDALIRHVGSVTFRSDQEKSAVARRLMESACWRMRKKLFGAISANLNQFFRGLDEAIMWTAVSAKGLFAGRSAGRELERSNYATVVKTSANLILKGDCYFEDVNRESRIYFNNGIDIPFPPETY